MDVSTAIVLLTINVIVLSLVIISLIIVTVILIAKLNKVATNVEKTTSNVAHMTEWLSPVKLFTEAAKAFRSTKNN